MRIQPDRLRHTFASADDGSTEPVGEMEEEGTVGSDMMGVGQMNTGRRIRFSHPDKKGDPLRAAFFAVVSG